MSTTSTDPISDMLTRIRNAIAVRKHEVNVPHSSVKEALIKLLKENNFVDDYKVAGSGIEKNIAIQINGEQSAARITEITRLSKPGRRHYVRSQEIPVVKRGRGIVIISTSKGMMSGDQAKSQRIGGELICRIY